MKDLIKKFITADDIVIDFYIDAAVEKIRNYLNTKETEEEIKTNYKNAIIKIAIMEHETSKNNSISSMTQGSRSVTYKSGEELDKVWKDLLPKPFLKARRGY